MPFFKRTTPVPHPDESLNFRALPGLVRIDQREIAHGREVPKSKPLVIVTSNQQWAHAALFRLQKHAEAPRGRCLIRLIGWVNAGCAGVGLANADGTAFIAEVLRTPHDGLTCFDLFTDSINSCSGIVIRNASCCGASKITIESILAYECLVEPASLPARVRWLENRATTVQIPAPGPFTISEERPESRDSEPAISLILTTKNGMPYLPDAIESLRCQEFQDFELVVQDCLSTDGGREFLGRVTDLSLSLKSEPDEGIGDAWSLAYQRCRGNLVGSIDCDNLLKPDALKTVVAIFKECPWAAAVYGAVDLVNSDGTANSCFVPEEFDLLRLLSCQMVPPWSTAFFSRRVCGNHLFFDRSFRVCLDFDVWLRISDLPILQTAKVLGSTRLSEASMSCRPDNYERFCEAKITALDNYLHRQVHGSLRAALLRYGTAGIYCWAAESVRRLGASARDIETFVSLALRADPNSARARLIQSSAG